LGTNRLNIFTEEYDRQLKNKTNQFFSSLLGEKYKYNLTAWWHPIKGVQFGGEFFVGTPPPTTDCYVARNFFMMPYMPVFSIGNHTIVFTKHWLKHQLFSEDIEFGRSSIPAIANMTIVFENYTNGYPPYNSKEVAVEAIKENFSALADGFFIDGIINVSNETVFPGIVEISLSYGFEKIRNSTQERLDQALGELFGEAVRTVDQCFWNLNTSISNPLSQSILTEFNLTLFTLLNKTFGSIDEAFDACERAIKGHISRLLHTYLDTFLETFIRAVLDGIDAVKDFADMIIDWLFDRISLNRAEAVLTIWVVRE
jgi:hypothetical protein